VRVDAGCPLLLAPPPTRRLLPPLGQLSGKTTTAYDGPTSPQAAHLGRLLGPSLPAAEPTEARSRTATAPAGGNSPTMHDGSSASVERSLGADAFSIFWMPNEFGVTHAVRSLRGTPRNMGTLPQQPTAGGSCCSGGCDNG